MPDQDSAASHSSSHVPWSGDMENSMYPFAVFDISRKALTGRLLKNKLFGFLTLGFYRFWGKTHLRRQMWQAIKIGEDRLEYHGTAKELVIGFLIAMVILSIIFAVVGLVLQFMSLSSSGFGLVQQYANFVLLYGFWQFARYRLWRYRLSRTSLRTIRFFLKGKALTYTGITLLWAAASILTLGWLYPVLRAKQTEYQVNNTTFGDQTLSYNGMLGPFYRIYWPMILTWQATVAAIWLYFAYETDFGFNTIFEASLTPVQIAPSLELVGIITVAAVISFLVLVFARVAEFRYIASCTRFAGAKFSSNLPVKKMLLIFGALFLSMAASFIAIVVLFTTATYFSPAMVSVIGIAVFFAVFVIFDIIKYLFLFVPMVKAICDTLLTDNVQVFEEVAASSHASPVYGEGLADALDVGAF